MKKVFDAFETKQKGIFPKYTDIFMAMELKEAEYSFPYNFPIFKSADKVPLKLIPFDKIYKAKADDFDSYVHFYIQDVVFERFWKNPKRYIPQLKKFAGCIMTDFSLCYDFPYPLQLYNCYRNRVMGYIMQKNGIPVIMNVSFGDARTYDFCSNGIDEGGLISTGSLGTMKNIVDRDFFEMGLKAVLKRIKPSKLLIYGTASENVKKICTENCVELHLFPSVWNGSFITREALNG